jgi:heterodisulfide reductase subunit A
MTMVRCTIDGRQLEVEAGKTILQAAEAAGVNIPTLCYHKSLLPYGACRLCVVEVVGRPRLLASCAAPAEAGMVIRTDSERVLKARRLIVALLLLRCPGIPQLEELAARIGVDETVARRFAPDNEKCVLCGLCVRACHERMAVGAIDFVNRGIKRKVGPPFGACSPICMTCGACETVCPTGAVELQKISANTPRPIPSEFNAGIVGRRAIYIPFAQAVPKTPVIDRENCMRFLRNACKSCEIFCQPKAIDYEQKDELEDAEVGAIVIATGYDLMAKARAPEFAEDKDIINGMEFERILCPSGPTAGKVLRPSDGKEPKEIVFISCVGSRDPEHGAPYCSRVCCMYLAKQAMLYKHAVHDGQAYVFYMDMRSDGKGYEEFVQRAVEEEGVVYLRGRVARVFREGDRIMVWGADTLTGKRIEIAADMVVLAMAMVPAADARDVAAKAGVRTDEHGFLRVSHPKLRAVETGVEGVFVTGAAQGPKDIPESVAQASAAASKALGLLSRKVIRRRRVRTGH